MLLFHFIGYMYMYILFLFVLIIELKVKYFKGIIISKWFV